MHKESSLAYIDLCSGLNLLAMIDDLSRSFVITTLGRVIVELAKIIRGTMQPQICLPTFALIVSR